jgi:hypothetical protein
MGVDPVCLKIKENRLLVFALFVGFDQLRNFRTGAYGLDQDNMALVQEHAVWAVPFIAPANQDVGGGFGFLIHLALNVVNVCQFGKL